MRKQATWLYPTRKYLQITYQMKDLYPEHIKTLKWNKKMNDPIKMGKRLDLNRHFNEIDYKKEDEIIQYH